jgi:hypothetical protein
MGLGQHLRLTRGVACLLALLCAHEALAIDLDDVHVTSRGRVYEVNMTFDVSASVDQVIAVLTDYAAADRLDPDVRKREVISEHDGITRVRTDTLGCVFFFCKEIQLTQDVTIIDNVIRADIVPDQSDFRSGYLLWAITPTAAGGAHIGFEAVIEPDSFILPVLGNLVIQKRLRKQVFATAENLAREAAEEGDSNCDSPVGAPADC